MGRVGLHLRWRCRVKVSQIILQGRCVSNKYAVNIRLIWGSFIKIFLHSNAPQRVANSFNQAAWVFGCLKMNLTMSVICQVWYLRPLSSAKYPILQTYQKNGWFYTFKLVSCINSPESWLVEQPYNFAMNLASNI